MAIDDLLNELDRDYYNEYEYNKQLDIKINNVKLKLNNILKYSLISLDSLNNCQIIKSLLYYYRYRCRFQIIHSNNTLQYVVWENGSPNQYVNSFPMASLLINIVMNELLLYINSYDILKDGIEAINFMNSYNNELIITLIYSKPIDSSWEIEAKQLSNYITIYLFTYLSNNLTNDTTNYISDNKPVVNIIGRSKGIKLSIGNSYIIETLTINNRTIKLRQPDDGFSNPNRYVNERVLNWICSNVIESIPNYYDFDLLELYCGNGNHTMALAGIVKRVIGVELNESLCESARINIQLNNITNVLIISDDSSNFSRNIVNTKSYISKDNDKYDFKIILVDPPRAGLDTNTCKLVSYYDYIIYISCCIDSLVRDLTQIIQTHEIIKFGIFDHFAYTKHIECGVIMRKL